MENESIYRFNFKYKPKFIDIFIASNYIVTMKPIRYVILLFALSFMVFLNISSLITFTHNSSEIVIFLGYIIIGLVSIILTIIGFELIIILITLIKLKSLVEFVVSIYNDRIVSIGQGISTIIKLDYIRHVKLFNKYIFIKIKDFPQTALIIIEDLKVRQEVYNFLKSQIEKEIKIS